MTPLLIEYEAVLTRPAVLAIARVSAEDEVVAPFNAADMEAGARRFGIAVKRPGTVVRRTRE